LIKLDSRDRSHHIKIGGLPLTITSNDTLRRRTYSFLCILQERFHPYSLIALGTSCNDACNWVLQNCRSINRHANVVGWFLIMHFSFVSM
jgi:hypothetical protein